MTEPVTYLYTFTDEETGELADILAPNESAARLWLGGDWMHADRCPLFAPPSAVGDWRKIVKEAQGEAAKALAAMKAAQPAGMTTPEALAAYNDAVVDHERKAARATKLIKMSILSEAS
jgi:hypothetical protein